MKTALLLNILGTHCVKHSHGSLLRNPTRTLMCSWALGISMSKVKCLIMEALSFKLYLKFTVGNNGLNCSNCSKPFSLPSASLVPNHYEYRCGEISQITFFFGWSSATKDEDHTQYPWCHSQPFSCVSCKAPLTQQRKVCPALAAAAAATDQGAHQKLVFLEVIGLHFKRSQESRLHFKSS